MLWLGVEISWAPISWLRVRDGPQKWQQGMLTVPCVQTNYSLFLNFWYVHSCCLFMYIYMIIYISIYIYMYMITLHVLVPNWDNTHKNRFHHQKQRIVPKQAMGCKQCNHWQRSHPNPPIIFPLSELWVQEMKGEFLGCVVKIWWEGLNRFQHLPVISTTWRIESWLCKALFRREDSTSASMILAELQQIDADLSVGLL